jgi:hypothetical protein
VAVSESTYPRFRRAIYAGPISARASKPMRRTLAITFIFMGSNAPSTALSQDLQFGAKVGKPRLTAKFALRLTNISLRARNPTPKRRGSSQPRIAAARNDVWPPASRHWRPHAKLSKLNHRGHEADDRGPTRAAPAIKAQAPGNRSAKKRPVRSTGPPHSRSMEGHPLSRRVRRPAG